MTQYSLEDVKKHNDNSSTWIVIHNNVYDVTAFLNEVSTICVLNMSDLYLVKDNCLHKDYMHFLNNFNMFN